MTRMESSLTRQYPTGVDYEGELAIVIGKKMTHVPEEEALSYVFGYTVANDVTARDIQKSEGQWTRGKAFDLFAPVGPRIVTGLDPAAQTVIPASTVRSASGAAPLC